MTSDNEKWFADHERFKSIRENYRPHTLQMRQASNDFSKSLLNVLFVLNGGGLLALPTLKTIFSNTNLDNNTLLYSGILFFIGLVFALTSGLGATWNFRIMAENYEARMNAALARANEESKSEITFIPSSELTIQLTEASNIGAYTIPFTYYLGWTSGLLSGIFFIFGGMAFGADNNPLYFIIKPIINLFL